MSLSHSLRRRIQAAIEQGVPKAPFDVSSALFQKQLPFVLDGSRYQTVVTPRRAGKTYAVASKLLYVAQSRPESVALYITKSRLNAKRIVWEILKQLNHANDICAEDPKEAELCLVLPNGSRIFLAGASHSGEIDNFRGLPLSIAIIDEAQSFPPYLEKLIDEVISPALTDFGGIMALVGTPGAVPVGYFYEKVQSHEWTHHTWSVFDNPFIQAKSGRTARELLDDELRRRGVSESDPVIQREWFGRWVLDSNSLVFRYDSTLNDALAPPCTDFVIGIDLGFDDADAVCVLGWSDSSPNCYLIEEWVGAKNGLTPLMERLNVLTSKYKPLAVVCDMGGLGKKIAFELQERTGIPIEAAEKERKLEHIELLNDAMRTGRFLAPKSSRFAHDAQLVEWDKSNPEKPKISDKFHSDICDAVLYAWRRCQQWLHVPASPALPRVGTPEWQSLQLQTTLAEIESAFESQANENRRRIQEEGELSIWG